MLPSQRLSQLQSQAFACSTAPASSFAPSALPLTSCTKTFNSSHYCRSRYLEQAADLGGNLGNSLLFAQVRRGKPLNRLSRNIERVPVQAAARRGAELFADRKKKQCVASVFMPCNDRRIEGVGCYLPSYQVRLGSCIPLRCPLAPGSAPR